MFYEINDVFVDQGIFVPLYLVKSDIICSEIKPNCIRLTSRL